MNIKNYRPRIIDAKINEYFKNFGAILIEGTKHMCVICGLSNAAYMREDGVYVVPITALKD